MLKAFLNWRVEHPVYGSAVTTNAARSKRAREALGKPGVKRDSLQREQLAAWFADVRLGASAKRPKGVQVEGELSAPVGGSHR